MSETWYPASPRSENTLEGYLAEHGKLPEPDRSSVKRNRFVSSGQADLGTWVSSIAQGGVERPLIVETWASEGNATYQTCFFSRIGLEDETKESVLEKFRQSGTIDCQEGTPCNLVRIVDAQDHPLWSFTICIGSGDMHYVTKAFPSYPFDPAVFVEDILRIDN